MKASKKSIILDAMHMIWEETSSAQSCYKGFISSHILYSANVLGKRIGFSNFIDLARGYVSLFPDLAVSMTHFEEYDNMALTEWVVVARHLGCFPEASKKDRGNASTFLRLIRNAQPEGKEVQYISKIRFGFDGYKICSYEAYHDVIDICKQLGLCLIEKNRNPRIPRDDLSSICSFFQKISEPSLSPHEVICLCLSTCGFTSKQVASFLCKSHRTVETQVQSALKKLGCFNKHTFLEKMHDEGFFSLWVELEKLLIGSKCFFFH